MELIGLTFGSHCEVIRLQHEFFPVLKALINCSEQGKLSVQMTEYIDSKTL